MRNCYPKKKESKEIKVYLKVKMADFGRIFGTQEKQNISNFQNYKRSKLGKRNNF
jgi:hypothetical protein